MGNSSIDVRYASCNGLLVVAFHQSDTDLSVAFADDKGWIVQIVVSCGDSDLLSQIALELFSSVEPLSSDLFSASGSYAPGAAGGSGNASGSGLMETDYGETVDGSLGQTGQTVALDIPNAYLAEDLTEEEQQYFREVLEGYIEEYGTSLQLPAYYDRVSQTGVVWAKVIDFSGSGQMTLAVVYTDEGHDSNPFYTLEIYDSQSIIYSGTCAWDVPPVVARYEDRTCIVVYTDKGVLSKLTMENGSIVDLLAGIDTTDDASSGQSYVQDSPSEGVLFYIDDNGDPCYMNPDLYDTLTLLDGEEPGNYTDYTDLMQAYLETCTDGGGESYSFEDNDGDGTDELLGYDVGTMKASSEEFICCAVKWDETYLSVLETGGYQLSLDWAGGVGFNTHVIGASEILTVYSFLSSGRATLLASFACMTPPDFTTTGVAYYYIDGVRTDEEDYNDMMSDYGLTEYTTPYSYAEIMDMIP